jgi:hypothetical protein
MESKNQGGGGGCCGGGKTKPKQDSKNQLKVGGNNIGKSNGRRPDRD